MNNDVLDEFDKLLLEDRKSNSGSSDLPKEKKNRKVAKNISDKRNSAVVKNRIADNERSSDSRPGSGMVSVHICLTPEIYRMLRLASGFLGVSMSNLIRKNVVSLSDSIKDVFSKYPKENLDFDSLRDYLNDNLKF